MVESSLLGDKGPCKGKVGPSEGELAPLPAGVYAGEDPFEDCWGDVRLRDWLSVDEGFCTPTIVTEGDASRLGIVTGIRCEEEALSTFTNGLSPRLEER
jgi:hypothetical protein